MMISPVWWQYLLPQHLLSHFAGFVANNEIPWLKNYIIKTFIKKYGVNLKESVIDDINDFQHFNDFFTRKLKESARKFDCDQNHFISYADGNFCVFGDIEKNQLLQAKGKNYSLEALLGSQEWADHFAGGQFSTIYLSPKDYHRVHMPIDGKLIAMRSIPGKLFSVNDTSAKHIDGLFALNERVVCIFETEFGKMAMVLVGAMIVASIQTVWAGTLNMKNGQVNTYTYPESPNQHIHLKQGDEMGLFHLGSTAICILEKKCQFKDELEFGQFVQVGQQLGDLS